MNREIIKLAREAGLLRAGEGWTEPARWGLTEVLRFAHLVAAKEREECAKLCDPEATKRAHRLASIAAEEFVRLNGILTDAADQFIIHGGDLSDEHFRDCLAHLKGRGECVAFNPDESMTVILGDYS